MLSDYYLLFCISYSFEITLSILIYINDRKTRKIIW